MLESNITSSLANFSIAEGLKLIQPLAVFILCVTIYAIFVFKFYKFVARKNVFSLNLDKYNKASHPALAKFLRAIFYVLEYILIFPLLIFFWFAVLAVLLSLLAENQTMQSIVMVSIALVAVVRITAYFKEELSNDLAKLLPFALLAILLIDVSSFNPDTAIETIKQLPGMLDKVIYYFLFVFSLEIILRLFHGLASLFVRKTATPDNSEEEA